MTFEVSKKMYCILIRGGVQLWIPEEKLASFDAQYSVARRDGGLMRYEGKERINPADVSGVFSAETMEASMRRKNGQWTCKFGNWHDKGERCLCVPQEEKQWQEELGRAIKDCGVCKDGWISKHNSVSRCQCCAHFFDYSGTKPKRNKTD